MTKAGTIATVLYLSASALIHYLMGFTSSSGVADVWIYYLFVIFTFLYCAALFFALDNGLKMLSRDSSKLRKIFGACIVLFILLMPLFWGWYTPVAMAFSIACLLWSLFVVKLQYMLDEPISKNKLKRL